MERAYYAVIPASVRYDKELPANAKLLYGEITALCNEKGYCWSTNQYFADLYGVSIRSVQTWIRALESKGYIHVELENAKGQVNTQRKIYLMDACRGFHGGVQKTSSPHEENFAEGVKKTSPIILQDNNTKDVVVDARARTRNTSRENAYSQDTNPQLAHVIQVFSNNIHPVTGEIELGMLCDLFQQYGQKWMLEAIDEAVSHHAMSVKYIKSILENWERGGYKKDNRKNNNAGYKKANGYENEDTAENVFDIAIRELEEEEHASNSY